MPADAGRDYGRRPSNLTDDDMDDIAMAAWAVHGFWTLHWSQFFTMNYRAPRVAGLYNGRNPQTTPVCYGAKGAFRLTADNAWYCHGVQDRFVAWDVGLMNRSASIGNAFLYLVVAHEWGHAIAYQLQRGLQFKAGELQADCLAGAALAGAIRDGALKMAPGDVGEFAAGLRSIADKTPWSKTGDHGSAAQRIGSFAIGARDSVWACLPK